MSRGSLLLFAYTTLLLTPFCSQTSIAEDNSNCTISCGNISISSPFRLKGDPPSCGILKYEVSCEGNVPVLYSDGGTYYVKAINYSTLTIRVVDAGVQKKGNQFSNPRDDSPYRLYEYGKIPSIALPIIFMECANPMHFSLLVETAPCINDSTYSSNSSVSNRMFSYFIIGLEGYISSLDLGVSCKITQIAMVSPSIPVKKYQHEHLSCESIYNEIALGFELSWISDACRSKCNEPYCMLNNVTQIECLTSGGVEVVYGIITFFYHRLNPIAYLRENSYDYPPGTGLRIGIISFSYVGLFQVAKFVFGFPCLIALVIYKCKRRHLSMYENIEDFLQSHKLMPVRYSYSDIRKMAKGFTEKLGEGGYGCVYKAKLRSGRLVAIKILGKSKANGQDFINEVATIGRIHHVNVVQLIGFCVEGSKRALVYDFMPNGSLDKHIFSQQEVISLSSEKMFEIALGVARGIEYLHRGCHMQILHFDIKPHNILLDENFLPKVSDFGLARLCPLDNSIVSLTAARGTIGYIAPELFYRNIGSVSYKADVYSFGMLLMEMAGKRKNLNATLERSSQIYFPTWAFDQLRGGNDLTIGDATEVEQKIIKKMIIVALWCIQMKPCDRPSMNRAVEMLEGEVESLEMPPKLFLYPQQIPDVATGDNSSITCALTMTTSTEIVSIADSN